MADAALFLDRDGTLVEDNGYVHQISDFKLMDGVIEGLKLASEKGFKLFIVTNQGGIGLEKFNVNDMSLFNQKLLELFSYNKIYVTAIKYCPHHPNAIKESMRLCNCRKPSAKMLFDISEEYNIDLKKSFMIGNSQIDVDTGLNAGCKTLLIKEKNFYESLLPILDKGTSE